MYVKLYICLMRLYDVIKGVATSKLTTDPNSEWVGQVQGPGLNATTLLTITTLDQIISLAQNGSSHIRDVLASFFIICSQLLLQKNCRLPSSIVLHHLKDLCSDQMSRLFRKAFLHIRKGTL